MTWLLDGMIDELPHLTDLVVDLPPGLFGFADESANVWAPHLIVGLAAIFLGLTTKQAGGYSYKSTAAAR